VLPKQEAQAKASAQASDTKVSDGRWVGGWPSGSPPPTPPLSPLKKGGKIKLSFTSLKKGFFLYAEIEK